MNDSKLKFYQILYTSVAVVLSIILAYAIQLILQNFGVNDATSKLAFAFTLPAILLCLQVAVRRFIDKHVQVVSPHVYKPKLSAGVMQPLNVLKQQIHNRFKKDYDIEEFDLYVLDWQKNVYLNLFSKTEPLQALPQSHALVQFAKQYRTTFTTEQHTPAEDYLTDLMLAEVMTFMKRHSYVMAIPLTTVNDVFGFMFLTLSQLKDTKAYALQSFKKLDETATTFGPLLQMILVYDAIVLSKGQK